MNLNSKKFKYLLSAQKILGEECVPSFIKIENKAEQLDLFFPSILRSTLKDEAEVESLLSGKSQSIGGLKNQVEFEEAKKSIFSQIHLEEVILQEEISWDKHLTLVYEKDFFFMEVKEKKQSDKPAFYYWTPIGQTPDSSDLMKLVFNCLMRLKSLTKTHDLWLMEMGVKRTDKALELFLFQIQPTSLSLLNSLFSQNLVQEMLLSRHRFEKNLSLLGMLKTEWGAYLFRKKHLASFEFHPSWIFLNWEFIFHYFRLYCLQKKLRPSQTSFGDFLTMSHSRNWMGEVLRMHFKFANQLRAHEDYTEGNFIFDQDPAFLFIGKGVYEEVVGEKLQLVAELLPETLYQYYHEDDERIILTKTVSLLGHGILAATERRIKVVAGIPDEVWESLKSGDRIYLDFQKRLFQLK